MQSTLGPTFCCRFLLAWRFLNCWLTMPSGISPGYFHGRLPVMQPGPWFFSWRLIVIRAAFESHYFLAVPVHNFFQNQQIYLSTASYGRSLLSTLMPYDKFTGTYENWKVCGRQKLTGSALKQDLSLFVGCNWWQLLKVLSKLTRIMIENCHTLRRIDLSRTLSFLVVNIWSLFAVAGHIINVLGEYSVENRVIWLRRTWCCSSGGWLSVLYASFGPSFAVSSFTLWCTTTFVKVLVLVLIWIKCMYWFVRRSNLSAHRMACFLLIKVCSRSKQRQERKYLPCRVARSSSGRLVHRVPPACRDSIRRNPNVVLLVFVLVCGAVNDIFNNVSDYFPRDCLDDKNSNITERK